MEGVEGAFGPSVSVLLRCRAQHQWVTVGMTPSLSCSSRRIEAVFEVNTDLQKNVQAKVTAQLTWPSLVNSSQRIMFPLTNINSSSVSRTQSVSCGHVYSHVQECLRVLLNVLLELRWDIFSVPLQDEEVTLQNPADVPVYVQVFPLALLPNPLVFSGKLSDRCGNHHTLCVFVGFSSKG